MGDWQDWVGRSETREDVLTAGLVARHRATLNAPAGDAPLPGIHWCLCLPDAPMDALGEDGHPRRVGLPTGKAEGPVDRPTEQAQDNRDKLGGFLPPIALPRRMWASSKVEFIAPLRPGQSVMRSSRVVSITEKQGGSGKLVFAEIVHEIRGDGEPARLVTDTDISERPKIVKVGSNYIVAWRSLNEMTRAVRLLVAGLDSSFAPMMSMSVAMEGSMSNEFDLAAGTSRAVLVYVSAGVAQHVRFVGGAWVRPRAFLSARRCSRSWLVRWMGKSMLVAIGESQYICQSKFWQDTCFGV